MEDERLSCRMMEEKVPGGKLARLSLSQGKVTLSGDFFIYPEDGIFLIEDMLSRLDGSETLEVVETMLTDVIMENKLELIGLDPQAIARLYVGAARVESHRP
jgi:lipoate-protein ligase A